MKLSGTILFLLVSLPFFGQDVRYFKTSGKKNLHYLEFSNGSVKLYKMGSYFDKAGSGSAVLTADTLFLTEENTFKGKHYTLIQNEKHYTLLAGSKKYETEPESDLDKVRTELNNAYHLKSYFAFSKQINSEFPLYHYSFRNGYYTWRTHPNTTIDPTQFIEQTNKQIQKIYDSISVAQNAFTKTTNFIVSHVAQVSYSILKDSLSTLPIDYRPRSGYFDKAVYQMVKSNPEYFYRLLQDFPTNKTFIFLAVEDDKELIKQLKKVGRYKMFKKKLGKEHR